MARILVIDDEHRILNFVSRGLRSHGFLVDAVADAAEGLRAATTERYDLVILDLLMPHMDGVAVLTRILEVRPSQAIVVLSALGDPASKVRCLELGAEDYLAKPFSLEELVARVRARLRRTREPGKTELSAGHLRLDLIRREADSGGGPTPLAEREFLLLQHLMANAGQTMSKERLLSGVWGYFFESGSNVLDVYVGRLRRKLGADAIETVRGEGYRVQAG
ncbi:MAG: response regulator transcription factor [Actinomycetota bacterium]|nr:response regulator transcription factor [Actinomycetota bacterium]